MVGYKKPCKYCDQLVDPDARVCPWCGKINPTHSFRCPRCRAPIQLGQRACMSCGLSLTVGCPSCGQSTFLGDYCERCGAPLLVTCPKCKTQQAPIGQNCIKCGRPLYGGRK